MNYKKKNSFSYANAVRRTTSLEIKEIPINEWLKNYGLDKYYNSIFVEKHILYNAMAPPNNKYPYEYSDLLTNIKSNVDLLFSFTDSLKFKEAISFPIQRQLMEMVNDGIITQDQYHDSDNYIVNKFVKAFELLLNQKLEYKAMLSVFGLKPTKTKYDTTLEANLEFLDNKKYISENIFKNEIIEKLKLISFDDLLQCKQTTFNLLLSLSIEDIKKYILYNTNKLVKITNGLTSSMNKKEFDRFIDENESLKVFESCYNNYDIEYVNRSLKSNFDAKSLLSTHRMDLLEYIFNPSKLIDTEVSEQIYATLFPDNDHIYIEKQFTRINKSIPKTILTDSYMKLNKNKFRIFFIQGHGESCTIKDYKKKNRVDFNKVFTKIYNRQATKSIYHTKYNVNMFNNVSTQPVGRKSIFKIIQLLNKILTSKYRNTFLQGLINASKLEQLRMLENIVHMYWNHYCIKNSYSTSNESLSPYLKTSRLKHKPHAFKYPKTDITTSDIVNFVKYGYKYPPINTQFYFETGVPNEGMLGIFELNEDNSSDLIKLDNKITSILKKDNKLKMGLKLNEVYEFRGDIPTKADEILKYNKALPSRSSNMYTLEELMELIYIEGDIKPNEYVVIFDNSCRGIKSLIKKGSANTSYNTYQDLSTVGQSQMAILRINSYEKSLEEEEELGGGSRRPKKSKKSKRYKRSKKKNKKYKSNKI